MNFTLDKSGLRLFRAVFLPMAFLVVVVAAPGQPQQGTGEIAGTVSSADGKGLAGALVILSSSESDASLAQVRTDASGHFVLHDVKDGSYSLRAALPGYQQVEAKPLAVPSASATVDLILMPLANVDKGEASSSENIKSGERRLPAFSPAGIEGTIAPSGYSTGLSVEETSQVMDRVGDFNGDLLAGFAPPAVDCDQEPQLRNAVQANPEGFGPNSAMGSFYLGHGEFLQSIGYLKRAFAAKPAETTNARALALAYLGAREYPDAIALLERLTAEDSTDSVTLRLLAMAYEAAGNASLAVAAWGRAATLDSGTENLFDCGIGMIGLGAAEEAAKLFTAATAAHPDSAKLWLGLGIAQDLRKQKADAVRALLRAVDLTPEYLPPYSFLAGLSGISAEADREIRRRLAALVVAQPESAPAHYDYALALWKQRLQSPEASTAAEIESELRMALAKDPKMIRAHFQLGVVYADSGDYGHAAAELREAVSLDPANAEAHYRLAQVYGRQRQTELAHQEMKEFLALHGTPATDENSPEADLQKLSPQLSRQISEGTPCQAGSH